MKFCVEMARIPLDNKLCSDLGKYVETLTHSGEKELDKEVMKKLKNICRLADGYVEHVYHLVMHQLEKQHSEIRLSAFQICNELFRRSHCFRELLVSNLQRVFELTCEVSYDQLLPPPRVAAQNLKRQALQNIQEWNKEFGDGYKKLRLGYNFLRHCKKVDFNAIELESATEQLQRREQQRRLSVVNKEKMKKVVSQLNELLPEITNSLTTLENCLSLLLPTPDNFFVQEEEENKLESPATGTSSERKEVDDLQKPSTSSQQVCDEGTNKSSDSESGSSDSEDKINIREYGIPSSKYTLEVNFNPDKIQIKETPENAPIFENAQDMYKLLINRYLPEVKKWIKIMTKVSESQNAELKKTIDLKEKMERTIKEYLHLKTQALANNAGSSSDDSDLEEVEEKNGYEEKPCEDIADLPLGQTQSKPKREEATSWNIWSKENSDKDPTSAQSTLSALGKKPSSEDIELEKPKGPQQNVTKVEANEDPSAEDRKSKLLAIAPKLPFDIDLYHWEDENIAEPTLLAVRAEGSSFWSAAPTDDLETVPVPEGTASLRTRVIEFTGKFEPVRWACRTPLPNGKLCPRRDRYKCPFHGPIVARDAMGQCTNPEDAARLAKLKEEEQQKHPDWQDPGLLQDIKLATGLDLKVPEKKGKKKKKSGKNKYPGLTDINARENTSITRLSKKIFNKRAMKRVARALDHSDHKRFRDKYGDQFNYMYDTS